MKWSTIIVPGALFLFSPGASADEGALELLSGHEVPENGVLIVAPAMKELTVFAGADRVDGRFLEIECAGCSVWRPAENFPLGAVLALDSEYGGSTARVVESAMAAGSEVQIAWEARPTEFISEVCCGLSEVSVGVSPPGTPEPALGNYGCPATSVGERWWSGLTWKGGTGQLLVQVDEWTLEEEPPGSFFSPLGLEFSALGDDAQEICLEGEVWDLLSEERQGLSICSAHPDKELQVQEVEPSFVHVRACPLPPDGYQDQWCDDLSFECRELADELVGFQQESQVEACTHYYELCDVRPPSGDNTNEVQSACTMAWERRSSTTQSSNAPWFWLVLGGAIILRRRRPDAV